MSPGESVISPSQVQVTPGYFNAMGVKLLRGRFFDERDGAKALRTVIVDEKLAKRFWPNTDPIGRRMFMPQDINNLLATNEKTVWLTVVGVIGDVKLHTLTEAKETVGPVAKLQAMCRRAGPDLLLLRKRHGSGLSFFA
jgi:hypothetical protein